MPTQATCEKELKPFGVEYLEEIVVPQEIALGSNKACCTTFISYSAPDIDTGSMTCIDGTDDPC